MRGLEISGRDTQLPHLARVLELLWLRFAIQNKCADADVARGRKRSGRACCFHAGKRREFRNQLREETRRRFVIRELRFGQTDPERQRPRRIHSDVRLLQKHEAAHHQAGADEKNECERDLGDDERIAHSLALRAAGASASTFLQRIDQLRVRGLECGQ